MTFSLAPLPLRNSDPFTGLLAAWLEPSIKGLGLHAAWLRPRSENPRERGSIARGHSTEVCLRAAQPGVNAGPNTGCGGKGYKWPYGLPRHDVRLAIDTYANVRNAGSEHRNSCGPVATGLPCPPCWLIMGLAGRRSLAITCTGVPWSKVLPRWQPGSTSTTRRCASS